MEIKLAAQSRSKEEKLGKDFIPAVIYGKGVDNQSLKLKKADFEKVFKVAGESNLIDLEISGKAVKVLVKEIQRDVMKNFFTHVDFYQVNMKEKITAEIPLHFIGESEAVKALGGVLIKDMDSLPVECLPGDLVDHIDIDISILKTYEDAIRVNDLVLPKGLTLVHHTNEVIAAVKEPKAEEEPTPVAETPVEGAEAAAPGAAAPASGAAAPAAAGENKGEKKEGGKK